MKRNLYKCYVWHENFGNDEYVVAASDKEEAMKELENRLDNETIYPAREWVVTYIGVVV